MHPILTLTFVYTRNRYFHWLLAFRCVCARACVRTCVLYTCVYVMCTCVCSPSWINMQRIEEDIGVSFSIAFWLIPLRQGLSLTPKLPLLARHADQWIPKICLSLLPKTHACPAGADPPLCLLNPGNRFLDIRGICRGWEEGSTGRCVTSEEHVEDGRRALQALGKLFIAPELFVIV